MSYGAWRFALVALAAGLAWRWPASKHAPTDRWERTLAATWILAAVWWVALTLLRWNAYLHDYDLAHLAGVLDQTSQGKILHSTHLGFSLLAQHLFVAHLLYWPVLQIFPTPLALQLGQTLSILGGSYALGKWAANRTRSRAWGRSIALAVLLHPAATGIAFSDYDPASIGFLACALALWWSDAGWRPAAAAALVTAYLSKEIFAPGGILLGLALAATSPARRREGFWIAGTGFIVLAGWILLRPAMLPPYDQAANFRQRFPWIDGGAPALFATIAAPSKAGYLLHLFLPLALLPLRAPVWAVFALPEMGINFLAGFGMTGMGLHYHYATLVALVASASAATETLPRARGALLAAAIAASAVSLNTPFSAHFTMARAIPADARPIRARYETAVRHIPKNARIGVIGDWHILVPLWNRDVATPLPYGGATARDLAGTRDALVVRGPADPALTAGFDEVYRSGDLAVFIRSSERPEAR